MKTYITKKLKEEYVGTKKIGSLLKYILKRDANTKIYS